MKIDMKIDDLARRSGLNLIRQNPAGIGHNAALARLEDTDGHLYVAKIATTKQARLDLEGWMLTCLRENGLKVPRVYLAERDLMIMDDLGGSGTKNRDFEVEAARALAGLHEVKGEFYGLGRDTVIGPLDQPNPQNRNWVCFFRDHRLLGYARRALNDGQIDETLMRDIDKLASRLDDYMASPAAPTLIHGDAWAGNILPGKGGGLAGFIDPAIYYADPEIELAFLHLMGGMGPAFFEAYHARHEVRPGFDDLRKDIYNLYPLLVHTILFGSGYARQVAAIVRRLV